METHENKARFIERVNDALIKEGGRRYSDLKKNPLRYVVTDDPYEIAHERVYRGDKWVNVTGDSINAMLEDVLNGGLI